MNDDDMIQKVDNETQGEHNNFQNKKSSIMNN